jgi:hypothetical protein
MIVIALGVAAASAVAFAAPKSKEVGEPAVVQHLLDCRKLASDAERLACYDKAAAAMESATASGDLVSIDREQRRAARRQAFGFTLPSLGFLDRGEKEGGADRVTATIAEVSQDPYGKLVIKLDDGAMWTQTEPEILGRRPHKGSTVVISKGMLGSYFMTIDGQGAGKAKRIG